jgi:hypothetical protein
MTEGYEGAIGCARALIESAQADRAMFMAMLSTDAKEIMGVKEGTLNESAVLALNEAAAGGIWKKIKELFTALIGKIKSICYNFVARFRSVTMKNKDLVKKYKADVRKKSGIDKLEVKWRAVDESGFDSISNEATSSLSDLGNRPAHDNVEDRWNEAYEVKDSSEYRDKLNKKVWKDDEVKTVKISEIGGINDIISVLEDSDKDLRDLDKANKTIIKAYEKLEKDAEKEQKKAASAKDGEFNQADLDKATNVYNYAQIENAAALIRVAVITEVAKKNVAQAKAAFMKAVVANPAKLKESATYLDAVAEAAEQEVEDVIDNAFKDEDISKVSSASLDVKDADVSDDPNEITYDPDSYTDDYKKASVDGKIDTDVDSSKCCESSIFSDLLY